MPRNVEAVDKLKSKGAYWNEMEEIDSNNIIIENEKNQEEYGDSLLHTIHMYAARSELPAWHAEIRLHWWIKQKTTVSTCTRNKAYGCGALKDV